MLINAVVEYRINPVVLDRFCQEHQRFCVAEVSDVVVEFDTHGIIEVTTVSGSHVYRFSVPWHIPNILVPEWLEVLVSEHENV